MLPQAYCDELKKLRSGVVPMPFETVEEILAAQYGRPAEDVFAWIDRTPLGRRRWRRFTQRGFPTASRW